MKIQLLLILLMLGCWSRVTCFGAENDDADFEAWGTRFVASTNIEYKVSPSIFKNLPQEILIYSRAAQTPIPLSAAEWVIDRSATNAAEAAALKARIETNIAILTQGKTFLERDKNGVLLFDPAAGEIHFLHNDFISGRQARAIKTNEMVLSKTTLANEFWEMFHLLNLDPAEIEKNPDGSTNLVFRDTKDFPYPERKAVLVEREINVQRTMNGFTLLPASLVFDEITMSKSISGQWKEIKVHWPEYTISGRVSLSCHSNDALKKLAESKKLFWDRHSDIGPDEAQNIVISGIRVGYMQSKQTGRLTPVLLLDADVKTAQSNSSYAVIFLPLQ
ncbi:MAG: hypothetical protein ACREFE_15970 [Limisphaerales bacterium]